MKNKLDVFFIYSIYIFELIYTFSSMFFNNYTSRHSISTNELGQPIYGKIGIFENVFKISYCMVFIVGVLYILFLIYKIKNHEIIDLKKNTFFTIRHYFYGSCFIWFYAYANACEFTSDEGCYYLFYSSFVDLYER